MGKRENYKSWDEDIKVVIQYAGIRSAAEIGLMIKRPAHQIYSAAKHYGIALINKGENHWNARLSNLQAEMILALFQAGFSAPEIQKACFKEMSLSAIYDITTKRNRVTT